MDAPAAELLKWGMAAGMANARKNDWACRRREREETSYEHPRVEIAK